MFSDSFCCPKLVPVRAFMVLVLRVAVAAMLEMCLANVMCVSNVNPKIVGFLFSGSGWSKRVR